MIAKALEVRDRMTFIPMLCVEMNPLSRDEFLSGVFAEEQRYLLRRCGYPCDGSSVILMCRLDGNGKVCSDPFHWGDRTFQAAHEYIVTNWENLSDGDVVDVEFILGETTEPKKSERETSPL